MQASQASIQLGAAPAGRRPIAATRHRRTDSLRSLRSQTSDGSSSANIATPGFPPPAFQSTFSPQRPLPNADLSPDQIPTAYVDLDFVLIRANRPFLQILASGHDVRGRPLNEVVTSADNESLLAIRNRLRGEREAREPAYMPPILPVGQDPLQGVLEADVDRLSQGFSDYTYTWMRAQFGSFTETFPARVRLAKAVSYFVVITLPSFRPMTQQPPPPPASAFMVPPPLPMSEGYSARRPITAQSAPPAFLYQTSTAGLQPPQQQTFLEPQAYRPPLYGSQAQPQYGYLPQMQQPPPITPRLPAAEPPTDTTPFTPSSTTRETVQPAGRTMQLPPIPSMPSAPSGARTETSPLRGSSEEEGEEGESVRSPKKRRRMGISDVLQR